LFTGLAPNTYNVTVQNAAGCISPATTLSVNALPAPPAAPTATVTAQPTCSTPTATITITAPTGAGLEYSVNGTSYQPTLVFAGLAPGNYNVRVRNTATGCVSAFTPVTVNAVPTALTPTGSLTLQSSCSFPFGRFVFSTPLGAQWEYSINGTTYQASTVFDNIPPGSYNAVVRDMNTGCVSASIPFTVNAVPNPPAAPTVSVVQPLCGNTGSITVTSPVGANFEYSLNNSPYQLSPVFNGLSGIPSLYDIRVRSIGDNCVSAATNVNLTASPAPAAFVATFKCKPTPGAGEIEFISPTGAAYEYSIDGINFQASPVFAAVPWGTYTVTYRVAATGCRAPSQTLSLAGIPGPVTVSVNQPVTCAGGSITVTSPIGPNYLYQLYAAGGGPVITWQPSPVFANLPPGGYTVLTGTNNAGCILLHPAVLTIGPLPIQPGVLNVSTVHPACGETVGRIILTPPAGANLEFSINGTTYQSATTFNNVPPGNYTVTVRNTATGCVSAGTSITVNPAPTFPTIPTGSVTTLPDCDNSGGTITVTAPVGALYEYSSNGGTSWQSSPVFTNLPPTTYSITVRNTGSGCLSQPLVLTVAAGPVRPNPPTLTTIQPDCTGSLGIITVTAPVGGGVQYSLDGTVYQTSPVFPNLTEALYLVRVKDASGCVSFVTPAIILVSAGLPAKPVITVVQPICPVLTGSITVTQPIGANIEYSLNGSGYQTSNIFPTVAGGNYSITARFRSTTCVSPVTPANIKGLTLADCTAPVNGDIYFPSAFTPNGDMTNDGFGPGPRSNLTAVSNYSMMVFNRYGEMVFKTSDPFTQWDGRYKGKMLANNAYTWVASYKYGTGELRRRKGSVMVVR
ncbi:MAG: gliding motility-associated C-terminal domain-containing protein, partial [Sphingobacteriales bacterium]